MMQQLATQRSQIAAFPETLPDSAAKRDPAQTSESVLPVSPEQSAAAKSGNNTSAEDSFAEVLNRQRSDEQAAEAKSKAAKAVKPASESEEIVASSSAQQSKKEASDTNSTATTESEPTGKQTGEPSGDPVGNPASKSTDKPAGDSESDAIATSGKMASGAEMQVETNERQDSATHTAQERIDNIAAAEENIADIAMLLGGNAAPTADGEPDYLAMVDAVLALQDKLTPAKDTPATANEPLSSEDIISMLPTDIGQPIEGDVLTKLQDWLNSLLPSEVPGDIQASPLQQMRGAEQVLSDLLALVKQVKAGAESEDAGTNNSLPAADPAWLAAVENMTAESADKAAEDSQLSEENLLALAMALLQGIPGERQNTKNDSNITVEQAEQELLPEIAAANVQLAEEPVAVAEVTDEALINQATLLVSLMRQVQQHAETPKAEANTETNVNADKALAKLTDQDALISILSESNDKTLQELAQVMTDSASKANPALTDTQLSQMRSQLTTGLEEMRAQLKQGHQPGIDLAALVQQTVQDVAPQSSQNIVLPVMQDVQQLTQLASMAGMSQGQEQQLSELITVARDVLVQETRQQHGDTIKSMQQQSVFEKPVNVQQSQGQQQIAEKIRWMVNGRQSMAEIRLDPPEMGSMQIRLNVSGDSASVSFVVQSQQAKEALNEAMPRLRDMFSEQGLDLGESFVSQQNSGEAGDGEFADQQGGGFGESAEEETKSQETHVVRPVNGLIDDYV